LKVDIININFVFAAAVLCHRHLVTLHEQKFLFQRLGGKKINKALRVLVFFMLARHCLIRRIFIFLVLDIEFNRIASVQSLLHSHTADLMLPGSQQHRSPLSASPSFTSLEQLLSRAISLTKEPFLYYPHMDILVTFALSASLLRAEETVARLEAAVPSLTQMLTKMQDLLARCFLVDHVSRLEFALLLKATFELLLIALCQRFAIQAAQAATSLMDRLQLLKPYIQPPSRMNCFFDLKELVNLAAHPKDIRCTISLTLLDDALHALLKVLQECVALLETATATGVLQAPFTTSRMSSTMETATTKKPAPTACVAISADKRRTKLCTYWQAGNSCPYANQCRFAHGQAEVVVAPKD
jgi:hypothetical protein